MLGSNEGIKLGYIAGKVLGTIFVNSDGTTLGILDGFFDCSNTVNHGGLFLDE